jgi:ATP-dependent Clp protease ATP-binding subunit ClpC
MSMWEPFTEAGRRAMVAAQETAQRRGINAIGADEIFIGAIVADNNPASEAIRSFGVTAKELEEAEASLPRGAPSSQEMVFSPEAKRVIELAFEEARSLQHYYIGAEHLVLAYLRDRGRKSDLITALHLNADVLRAKILEGIPR